MILNGPSTTFSASTAYPALVQVKATWAGDWLTVPELEFVSGGVRTGVDRSHASFRRRYGSVKLPWESDFGSKGLWLGLSEWWVRVLLAGPQGYRQAWIGQFVAEPSDPHSPQAHGAAGSQELIAEGPERILHRTPVSRSFWEGDAAVEEMGFAPDFNPTTGTEQPRKTRSTDRDGNSYTFAGGFWAAGGFGFVEAWTAHNIAEYLLDRFCDASDDDGPAWSLTGVKEPLEDDVPEVRMSGSRPRTVAEVLADLIGRHQALDFRVRPTDDGFQVEVFSLLPEQAAWAGAEVPANTTRVPIWLDTEKPLSVRIVHDDTRRYKKIRVLGERIVVCASLFGADVYDADEALPGVPGAAHPYAGSLVGLWPAVLETAYAATYYDRPADKFRMIFRHFGPPADWDYHGGLASPKIDADGGVNTDEGLSYQSLLRETLDWTPLRHNVDYTTDPETDNNEEGDEAAFLPPAVWLGGYSAPPEGYEHGEAQVFVPVELESCGVSVDRTRLGVILSPSHPEFFGLGHDGGWAKPLDGAKADYEKLVATLAWHTDHRWGYEITADDWSPADGVYEEIVEGAECWVLGPRTVVGLTDEGMLDDSGADPRILRIDEDAVKGRLAGILGRYYLGRSRASVEYAALGPWSELLGKMLDIRDGAQGLIAPITGVDWRGDPRRPATRITAGLAR